MITAINHCKEYLDKSGYAVDTIPYLAAKYSVIHVLSKLAGSNYELSLLEDFMDGVGPKKSVDRRAGMVYPLT